jgi:broad specificity phosphatase PhoE
MGEHSAVIEFYVVQHGEKERGAGDPPLTRAGVKQARRTGTYLRAQGVARLCSSPLRRARETAEIIGDELGLAVEVDNRLRERMNWGDGPLPQTLEDFLREWQRTATDRDFTPVSGDSSWAAGERFHSLLEDVAEEREGARLALVTHGGVTVDLLRNLFPDDDLRRSKPDLLDRGIPPCAITHLIRRRGGERRYELQALASVAHLR